MNALFVIAAALSFTLGGYFMKYADGFSSLLPSLLVLALFGLGATLQTFAMRQQEMTTLYVIVLGVEAISALLLGTLFLGEALTWQKVVGGVIVCAGILILRH